VGEFSNNQTKARDRERGHAGGEVALVVAQREAAEVHLEDLLATLDVGPVDGDLGGGLEEAG
jgi:hypothetical protein